MTFLENKLSCRCPVCEHVSVTKGGEDLPYTSLFGGDFGEYFICTNPNCKVDKIYAENAVMLQKVHDQ